jgi:hypothetical protein
MEVLEGFGTGINRRRFLHSTVSGAAIGIASQAGWNWECQRCLKHKRI